MFDEAKFISSDTLAFINKEHKLFIGGRWCESDSGKSLKVESPASGAEICNVVHADFNDIDRAVSAARDAYENGPWGRMAPMERSKIIWKLGDLIEENGDELAEIDSLDNGKPIGDARNFDVQFSADLFRYMSGWASKLHGDTIPVSIDGSWHAYTRREPVGVCGQIVPWNFPLMMAAWKLAPSMAAGCTSILKPAEQTPLSALRLAEIAQDAGVPDGVINVLTGDGSIGAAMVKHQGINKIAFTGSTAVGKSIVSSSSINLKRVSVELGGKSPVLVFPDADLQGTVDGTANGIFFNTGQACTAGSRVYIHKNIFDNVVSGLVDEAQKHKLGPGVDTETTLGPLISNEQYSRVTGYIEQGESAGAEVVTERWSNNENGYFIKPTVLVNTNDNMSVVQEEIFGPVVCAMPFSDGDLDAIAAQANNSIYGLGASIWTKDLSVAHQLAAKIQSGTVWVNSHLPNDVALPFGGYKQSGYGREMGYEALLNYTELKSVLMKL